MSITTNDLAKLCGVSRTTVLRALNGTGRISAETKQFILDTAKENGYRPDLLARGLVKGKTYIIGVVVLDVKNRYFAQMLSTISKEARRRGYGVNIMLHDNNKEQEKEQISRLADYRVDGIIVSSINKGDEYVKYLKELKIPIVSVDNKIAEGIPFVGIAQRKAMKEVTEAAIQKGYKKLVLVCPPLNEDSMENVYVHKERYAGFLEAVESKKDVSTEYLLDWKYLDKAESCIDTDLRTAFICAADEFALAIMKKLKEKGKRASADYGIVGFDDIDMLDLVIPRLCTVSNSVEDVAVTSINMLLKMINGEKQMDDISKEITLLPYKYISGETL